MVLDSVIKRLMLTAINYAIGEAKERAKLSGMVELKKSLGISDSDDFRAGMICGEAYARAPLMIRMYMGREATLEEANGLLALLANRDGDISGALFKRP